MTGIIFGGLVSGSLFAIVAIGLVLIYRTSNAINFAQADVGTTGAFAAIALTSGMLASLPFILGAIAGVLVSAALSVAIYLLVIRRIEKGRSDIFSTMVATLGVSLLIEGILQIVFGFNPYAFALFPKSAGIELLGVQLPAAGLAIVASAVLALAALAFVLYRTRVGLIVRMGGSSETLTQLSGVRVVVVRTTVWAVAGALGGWALILYANYEYASPTIAGGLLLSSAVAASWGRFRSIPWTLVGAVITGIVIDIVARYVTVSLTQTVSLVMLIIVFLVLQRTQKDAIGKLHGINATGVVRAFRQLHPRIGLVEQLIVVVAALVGWFVVAGYQQSVLVQIMTYAIAVAALSLSIRYNGRLNLSAAGFLAVGGYTSAVLDAYMPEPLALVVAMAFAGLCGLTLGALTARMETIFYVQISLLVTASVPELVNLASPWTMGNEGLTVSTYLSNTTIAGVPASTFIVIILGLAALLLVAWLGRSRYGVRALVTARDQRLGESLGLRSRWQFMRMEGITAALLALSGALTAHTTGFISPDEFTVSLSVMLLAAVVLSGGWTTLGMALGALVFVLIPSLVGSLSNLPQIIFGLVLVLVVMFAPSGIEGWLSSLYRVVQRPFAHPKTPGKGLRHVDVSE